VLLAVTPLAPPAAAVDPPELRPPCPCCGGQMIVLEVSALEAAPGTAGCVGTTGENDAVTPPCPRQNHAVAASQRASGNCVPRGLPARSDRIFFAKTINFAARLRLVCVCSSAKMPQLPPRESRKVIPDAYQS
jgi:hypothetical protein